MKILVSNRKAFYDYWIIEELEAGIQLKGSEIKAIRSKNCSIAEAWIRIINHEAFLIGATIPPYENAASPWATHDPTRDRKLLLKKKEILKLEKQLEDRLTIIPLDIHLTDRGLAKMKIALVRGKKSYDKRETIKNRDLERYGD